MSDGIEATVTGAHEWLVSLARAETECHKDAQQVFARAAFSIKVGAAKRWQGHPHLKHLPRAINYDLTHTWRESTAEIGVDKSRRQGPLANIAEYGSVNNAPIPALGPALADEAPRFEQALGDLGAKLLEKP